MLHRVAISSLWFVAFLSLHELAWSVFGSPRVLGLVIGGLAASFVWVDPLHLVSPGPAPVARGQVRASSRTSNATDPR